MTLKISDLKVLCIIGDRPEERLKEQELMVDVDICIPDGAADSDNLADTVDYAMLAEKIKNVLKESKPQMIERAAKIVHDAVSSEKNILSAEVRIKKSGAVENLDSAEAVYPGKIGEREIPGMETIARGICILGNKILLCRGKKAGNAYLPGGHIEFGETARQALRREMLEETGLNFEIGHFRGALENSFMQDGIRHCEVNFVFEMMPTEADMPKLLDISSQESWIGFEWVDLKDLKKCGLLPCAFGRLQDDRDMIFGL
jgi:FolB domain-containing protein